MVMPASAQAPMSGALTATRPKPTMAPMVCIGTRPRSWPSSETTTFSPSLLIQAPCVVT